MCAYACMWLLYIYINIKINMHHTHCMYMYVCMYACVYTHTCNTYILRIHIYMQYIRTYIYTDIHAIHMHTYLSAASLPHMLCHQQSLVQWAHAHISGSVYYLDAHDHLWRGEVASATFLFSGLTLMVCCVCNDENGSRWLLSSCSTFSLRLSFQLQLLSFWYLSSYKNTTLTTAV